MPTDTERLDWLQKEKDVTFEAANSHAKKISKVEMFTIQTQWIEADTVRELIDRAINGERHD